MTGALLAACLCLTSGTSAENGLVIIVVGAPGAEEYDGEFRQWADRWQSAVAQGGARVIRIGGAKAEGDQDRDTLKKVISEAAESTSGPLWIVLIGHGTFDGRDAKFNLRGPDFSAAELTQWLAPATRPLAVLNCASASGPFLKRLSAPNRIIVTATRSGDELNFAQFGRFLSEAIADPAADLDKDEQVSLLEAHLTAASRVEEFYKSRSRLATEHALLDDNGDGLGTPADWFRGVRAVKRAKDGATADGIRAHQLHLVTSQSERDLAPEVRRRRDELELEIAVLRNQKAVLPEEEYYARLQRAAVELARIYRDATAPPAAGRSDIASPGFSSSLRFSP